MSYLPSSRQMNYAYNIVVHQTPKEKACEKKLLAKAKYKSLKDLKETTTNETITPAQRKLATEYLFEYLKCNGMTGSEPSPVGTDGLMDNLEDLLQPPLVYIVGAITMILVFLLGRMTR